MSVSMVYIHIYTNPHIFLKKQHWNEPRDANYVYIGWLRLVGSFKL